MRFAKFARGARCIYSVLSSVDNKAHSACLRGRDNYKINQTGANGSKRSPAGDLDHSSGLSRLQANVIICRGMLAFDLSIVRWTPQSIAVDVGLSDV